ncbi:hypothetical protein ES703_41248 [subsurface metagenome]
MALTDPGVDRGIWRARGPIEKVSLAENCLVGDVLGQNDNNEWVRALATTGSVVQGKRVALESGKVGETIDATQNPVVVGYSGATPESFVYVAEGSDNGKITETKPTDSGDADTAIGIALTASVVVFFLGARPETLAT